MALFRTVSEIKGDICKKISRTFNALAGGFPWNFVTAAGSKKTRMTPLSECQKSDDMSIRLDTVQALERQTDRQNW